MNSIRPTQIKRKNLLFWLILGFLSFISQLQLLNLDLMSTGERPFIDILQDRRYWVIHLITIPSLFLAGCLLILSGFVYKLFGLANLNQYFYKVYYGTQISLIGDRFSILNEISDVQHQVLSYISVWTPLLVVKFDEERIYVEYIQLSVVDI